MGHTCNQLLISGSFHDDTKISPHKVLSTLLPDCEIIVSKINNLRL